MTFLFMGTWAYIGSSLQRDCKISWKLVGVVELTKLSASQNTTFYLFLKVYVYDNKSMINRVDIEFLNEIC